MLLAILIVFVKIVVIFSGVMLTVAYLSLFERKWAGRIQVRYGPMRCGGLWGNCPAWGRRSVESYSPIEI